ncbi:ABC transporter permease [Methanobacterium petrolearium]|uniref:ABC transporter permease n=1 Tax=Methanobacterium petrolearium TaxID=710190 RepID=UPI001AE84FD8|nr:ABC transporter permease [Methanobacterium petrolearium]MBP1945877.1 ABC-2 type transport system permease protein [Methanobacterium petrolearium]BDZ69571.1 daunorubicin ABC transporter permease [Methanobacterium petrolearium]
MAELEGIYTIWLRENKRFLRYRSRLLTSVITPLLWLLIFGTGLGSAIKFSSIPEGYQAFLFPGIIGQTILFTSIFSGLSVIQDRQFGFLKEILVAPISRPSIVLGKAIGISTTVLIQGFVLLILSFVVNVPMDIITLLASMVVIAIISLGLSGLGLLIASFTDSMEGFNLIMSFIVMPLFLLSGALFPVSGLPTWLQTAVYLDPLTYGIDALRAIILNSSSLPLYVDMVVITFFALVMILISALVFSKKEQSLM